MGWMLDYVLKGRFFQAPGRHQVVQVYADAVALLRQQGSQAEDVTKRVLHTIGQKTTIFSPAILIKAGIPVSHTVQRPGELVIVCPRAYHAGLAHGQCIGETAALATRACIDFVAEAAIRSASLNTAPVRTPSGSPLAATAPIAADADVHTVLQLLPLQQRCVSSLHSQQRMAVW
jgi:hypothetical protein